MLHNKNLLAGLLFTSLGIIFQITARNYAFGTLVDMGPGFFPKVLASTLFIFGAILMIRGFKGPRDSFVWGIKPLALITLAIISFGFLLPRFGLLPAIAALVFFSTLAGQDSKLREFPYLFLALAALSMVVFIWGLKAPYPLFSFGV